jgi:membrane fusion protein (multidrug efflux system)
MKFVKVLFLFLMCACVMSCKQKAVQEASAPLVEAETVIKADIPMKDIEFPAQIAGSLEIEVRAQVSGILKERNYTEGAFVEKGAQLFLIDPDPFKVALDKANGALAQNEAELKRAKREYDRMKLLMSENAISQKEHDDALSAYEKAEANLKVAKATVNDAKINLGYTKVVAPISGITSSARHSEGSLITLAGDASILTTMAQIDPLYILFSVPSAQMNNAMQLEAEGKIGGDKEQLYVEIILPDGTVYPDRAKIFFVDKVEDAKTGTIALKAEVPNPNKTSVLMPGKFVRVRLMGATFKDAVLTSARSIISTPSGSVVYIVDKEGNVTPTPVNAITRGNAAIINSGLSGGETIVTDGIVKVGTGKKVEVKMADNAAYAEFGLAKPDAQTQTTADVEQPTQEAAATDANAVKAEQPQTDAAAADANAVKAVQPQTDAAGSDANAVKAEQSQTDAAAADTNIVKAEQTQIKEEVAGDQNMVKNEEAIEEAA